MGTGDPRLRCEGRVASPARARNLVLWAALFALLAAAAALAIAYSRVRGELPPPSGRYPVVQRHVIAASPAGPLRLYLSYPAGAARGKFPLILFASGWGGAAGDSPLLLAELASHGYFIAAFDDVALDVRQDSETEADYLDRTARFDYADDARFRKSILAGERRVAWQARRASVVLDAAIGAQRRDEEPFRPLDPARVGFVGFSFGGAVAAETSRFDPRVRAAVNLDGSLFGESARHGVRLPYLVLSSSQNFPPSKDLLSPRDNVRINAQWARSDQAIHAKSLGKPGFSWLELIRSRHMDLTDALFHAGLRDAARLSWEDRLRIRRAVARTIHDFLRQHVEGETVSAAPHALDGAVLRVVTRPGPP